MKSKVLGSRTTIGEAPMIIDSFAHIVNILMLGFTYIVVCVYLFICFFPCRPVKLAIISEVRHIATVEVHRAT